MADRVAILLGRGHFVRAASQLIASTIPIYLTATSIQFAISKPTYELVQCIKSKPGRDLECHEVLHRHSDQTSGIAFGGLHRLPCLACDVSRRVRLVTCGHRWHGHEDRESRTSAFMYRTLAHYEAARPDHHLQRSQGKHSPVSV